MVTCHHIPTRYKGVRRINQDSHGFIARGTHSRRAMEVQVRHLSTQEAEAERSQDGAQPGLQSEALSLKEHTNQGNDSWGTHNMSSIKQPRTEEHYSTLTKNASQRWSRRKWYNGRAQAKNTCDLLIYDYIIVTKVIEVRRIWMMKNREVWFMLFSIENKII